MMAGLLNISAKFGAPPAPPAPEPPNMLAKLPKSGIPPAADGVAPEDLGVCSTAPSVVESNCSSSLFLAVS
ncbi:hypothetical protein WICPIJ_001400 [Wickerhamomyces pijperi]|uniref:Uncharacterized protein n=1 Tax=Wickerhamomyces pijperi TaxID=599730 RepID=A0A9P8TQR0_WICPI|nr:hypothetical protein WICPIJ_001400 [Wickerhamomyces pijperi]